MRQVYIYPDRTYSTTPDTNPYRENLAKGFECTGDHVIRSKTAWLGTMDFFLFLRRMDLLVLNWIEEVANRKFGYIQVIAFLLCLPLFRLFNVKIVWTIHNKEGHSKKNLKIAKYLRFLLFKYSDFVVTHAKDGQSFFRNAGKNVNYFPHPFDSSIRIETEFNKQYDLLIWGKLQPYKGILEFLSFLHQRNLQFKYKICVKGHCPDETYYSKLKALESDTILIENKFLSDIELSYLMSSSDLVVFTHKSDSVLSSGALIDSLTFKKTVIGPSIGNFNDFAAEGVIYTYQNFENLIDIIDGLQKGELQKIDSSEIQKFINKYSWTAYSKYLMEHVSRVNSINGTSYKN